MADPEAKGDRTCPVCDESVPIDASRCHSCSTDLTMFELNGKRIEVDGTDVQTPEADSAHMGDLLKAADEELFAEGNETQSESVEVFECPECHAEVPMDASVCPGCGVQFAEEEAFECPLCKTLVDMDTDKCPSCGAEFTEGGEGSEESPSQELVPEQSLPLEGIDKVPEASEEPKPEKEPKVEMSFAERMKAMKEGKKPTTEETPSTGSPTEPSPSTESATKPEQQKSMSFAERMKAMKEGKQVQVDSAIEPPAPPKKISEEEKPSQVGMPSTLIEGDKLPEKTLKDEYKELPKLIAIVKKHLALAKRCKLDVSQSRAQINQAVAAGKSKDLDTAVRLVKEGKKGIEDSISKFLNTRLELITSRMEEGKKSGQSLPEVEQSIPKIRNLVQAKDFDVALAEIEATEPLISETQGGGILDAVNELKKVEGTIQNARVLNMDVSEAQKLYIEAKKAAESENWDSATLFSKQSMDSLSKILPGQISSEMHKAKESLLEIKLMNVNISKPVEFLKEASIALKGGDLGNALHSIKQFKNFMEKEDFMT